MIMKRNSRVSCFCSKLGVDTQGPAEVTPLSVAGGVRERLARDGQELEHVTCSVTW